MFNSTQVRRRHVLELKILYENIQCIVHVDTQLILVHVKLLKLE